MGVRGSRGGLVLISEGLVRDILRSGKPIARGRAQGNFWLKVFQEMLVDECFFCIAIYKFFCRSEGGDIASFYQFSW